MKESFGRQEINECYRFFKGFLKFDRGLKTLEENYASFLLKERKSLVEDGEFISYFEADFKTDKDSLKFDLEYFFRYLYAYKHTLDCEKTFKKTKEKYTIVIKSFLKETRCASNPVFWFFSSIGKKKNAMKRFRNLKKKNIFLAAHQIGDEISKIHL